MARRGWVWHGIQLIIIIGGITMLNATEKAKEQRLRYALNKIGCTMHKSRKPISVDNMGEYMLIDCAFNCVIANSGRYDMTLDDIANWLE